MRVLVVGLNPSKQLKNSPTVKTLNKWLDELDLKMVSFINLYEGWEIDQGDNQRDRIKSMASQFDKVIALGTVVSSSLDLVAVRHFKLPHPSGLNRQLNDQNYVHQQLEACKNYLYRG